jgi:hypothetical protein
MYKYVKKTVLNINISFYVKKINFTEESKIRISLLSLFRDSP